MTTASGKMTTASGKEQWGFRLGYFQPLLSRIDVVAELNVYIYAMLYDMLLFCANVQSVYDKE